MANLFVGGFPYETDSEALSALFCSCGTVKSVKVLLERDSGRPRGLAFVEMSSDEEAAAAISKLDGSDLGGRKIFVTKARPKEGKPDFKTGPAGKPGFVERRSGKDRRKGGAKPAFEGKKWADKPREYK